MTKVIVHRGTGSIIDVQDDLWVIDDSHIDEATGDIDDDVLLAHGDRIVDVVTSDEARDDREPKILFSPDQLREYARGMPSWFPPGMARWMMEGATDTDLTMIADGICDDDELWYLINRLIARHADAHLMALNNGAIDPSDR